MLFFPSLLFLAYLLVYLVLHYGKRPAKPEQESGAPGWAALKQDWKFGKARIVAGGLAAAAVFAAAPPTSWRRPAGTELVFLEKGVVSFTKPDYTRYGKSAGGMFGMLPEYARAVRLQGRGGQGDPGHPRSRPGAGDHQPRPGPRRGDPSSGSGSSSDAGGGLWVLGDHTFIKNGRNHINDLLAPDATSRSTTTRRSSSRRAGSIPTGSARARRSARCGTTPRTGPASWSAPRWNSACRPQPFVLGRFGYSDWGTDGGRREIAATSATSNTSRANASATWCWWRASGTARDGCSCSATPRASSTTT